MTIKDIAKESGYAIGTVSRVLNNNPSVSPAARAKILEVIKRYNYQPNSNAKHLKQQSSDGLALIVKGTQNMLFVDILEKMQAILEERGYVSTVYYIDEEANEVAQAELICAERKPYGIVFLGSNLEYFTPKQGTNRWHDAMVITKDCSEVQLAHEFINFMISDKSALSNTEEVGYTSTVKSAFETMKEGDYAGISSYIPDTTNPNNEIFAYQQPKIKQKFAELWTKVKAK